MQEDVPKCKIPLQQGANYAEAVLATRVHEEYERVLQDRDVQRRQRRQIAEERRQFAERLRAERIAADRAAGVAPKAGPKIAPKYRERPVQEPAPKPPSETHSIGEEDEEPGETQSSRAGCVVSWTASWSIH